MVYMRVSEMSDSIFSSHLIIQQPLSAVGLLVILHPSALLSVSICLKECLDILGNMLRLFSFCWVENTHWYLIVDENCSGSGCLSPNGHKGQQWANSIVFSLFHFVVPMTRTTTEEVFRILGVCLCVYLSVCGQILSACHRLSCARCSHETVQVC